MNSVTNVLTPSLSQDSIKRDLSPCFHKSIQRPRLVFPWTNCPKSRWEQLRADEDLRFSERYSAQIQEAMLIGGEREAALVV
jgi:hypothetical protein